MSGPMQIWKFCLLFGDSIVKRVHARNMLFIDNVNMLSMRFRNSLELPLEIDVCESIKTKSKGRPSQGGVSHKSRDRKARRGPITRQHYCITCAKDCKNLRNLQIHLTSKNHGKSMAQFYRL